VSPLGFGRFLDRTLAGVGKNTRIWRVNQRYPKPQKQPRLARARKRLSGIQHDPPDTNRAGLVAGEIDHEPSARESSRPWARQTITLASWLPEDLGSALVGGRTTWKPLGSIYDVVPGGIVPFSKAEFHREEGLLLCCRSLGR
jgi:hypothetical protein